MPDIDEFADFNPFVSTAFGLHEGIIGVGISFDGKSYYLFDPLGATLLAQMLLTRAHACGVLQFIRDLRDAPDPEGAAPWLNHLGAMSMVLVEAVIKSETEHLVERISLHDLNVDLLDPDAPWNKGKDD